MRIVRIVLPALVGCLFLLFGVQSIAGGLQAEDPGALGSQVHIAAIPLAIGIVLLLASMAIARRTRLGFLLGVGVGALLSLAGLATIVVEIPYLQQGGLSAALGGGIVIFAAIWAVFWLAYTWRFSKAGPDFAPAWVATDRRLGAVIGIVVAIAAATFLGTVGS